MKKKSSPFISVIIPVQKLSYYLIFEALPEFEKQKYKNFEIVTLPNEHSQYDLTLLKKYPWLRIVPTGKITKPAEKRNIGVKEAKGEIIAFIDDDAFPQVDWLNKAAKLFKRNIKAVCGPGILPKNSDRWEKIFDEVLKSWIGSGEYAYRFTAQRQRFVDDYPSMNFFIRKKLFLALGGFKGNYWPGEDSKLCEEIVYREKGKILYSPEIIVYHHRRKELKGFLRQHANYSFHRGAFFAHGDKNSLRLSYLIPTFFVLYLIILLFIIYLLFIPNISYLLSNIIFFPLILYLFFSAQLFFSALFNTKSFIIAFYSPSVLFLTHLTYGIMFVIGFIKGIYRKENIYG